MACRSRYSFYFREHSTMMVFAAINHVAVETGVTERR
jgi:hypothetical protein